MPHLELALLGPFQAALDGQPVTGFESNKAKALLAFLSVEADRPHARESLAGLLWPDSTNRMALASLRHALTNLRRILGDRQSHCPRLLIARDTIQFNTAGDHSLDVAAFERRVANGEWQAAIRLYGGGFLEGFSIQDSPAFEEWALFKREQFRRQMLNALYRQAAYYEGHGEYEQAEVYARRQVELEPWQEEAYQQLMRILALSGQRSAALAQYEACHRSLEQELGVEPATETTRLYEQIRDGEYPVLGMRKTLTPHPITNLPAPLIPLIGREAELAEINARLQDPACRLLTLFGPGGIGKTRLALEAAAEQVAHFADGVYLVSLASLGSAEAIVPTVAEAIGFSFYEGKNPRRQLLNYLRPKQMLLIMDNCEHLPDGASVTTDILQTAPGIKIIATSQARLNAPGEHIFPVTGLSIPAPRRAPYETSPPSRSPLKEREAKDSFTSGQRKPDDMAQYGAIRLFVQSAHRTHPGFELASADGVKVAHICRLVQGLPLGILLAAAWVGALTPAEIASELEQSLDFLEADGCDVPERQRSLRAVFDYAWRLLTAREQPALLAMSVFRGGCTREAAQQVTGASLRELKALVIKSLLQYSSSGRYEIHQLVWQYVAEKLDRALSSAERASLYDRHSAYYVAALQLSAADFSGPRQQAALAAVEADSENIRAAWYWAVEQGQVERLEQAMEGLELFYWSSGRYHEGEAAFRAAAEKLATHESAARVLVRALAWQSNFRRLLGQRDSAHQLLQQCMALLARPEWVGQDTRSERALVFWLMGHTVFGSDRDRARQWYEQSLALYREIDRVGTANALRDLGRAAIFLGAFREARLRLEESLAIRQELDDPRGIADAMADLAEVALLQGQFEESELVARESCTRSQELGHRAAAAYSMLVYGETLEAAGEFAEAQAPLEECLTVYEDLGHHDYIAYVHAALGSVALHLGEYEHAHAHAQTSLALARQHGLRYRQGFPLLVSGCVALTAGACVEARQLLHESVAVYREIGQPHDVGWALAVLGYAVRELGDQRPAQHHLAEALQLAVATQAVAPLAWALPAMALLLADQGAPVRAVELYALASRHPLVARSRWFEDVAGGRMSALANTLPASMVVTAQERGQGRNLDAVVQELIAELAAIQ